MPDANVPGIGGIPKPFLIGGVILAGGIGLYAYRKKKSEDAVAAATALSLIHIWQPIPRLAPQPHR